MLTTCSISTLKEKNTENRINISELEPNVYQAMFGLQAYLNSTELDRF